MQSSATIKHSIQTPLLFAVVLGVVMLAAFSPLFSSYTYAVDYKCATPFGGCFDTIYTDPTDTNTCDGHCSPGGCVPASQCTSSPGTTAKDLGKGDGWSVLLWGLIKIVGLINRMLVIFVAWVAQLLDATIALSLAGLGGIGAITIGWGITRDVANIFFIFILLVIAIATILRLESYGAKQLLPKLIVIALLINFSLIIAATVVDLSNVLALAFIGEIHPVSDHIAAILQINKIEDIRPDIIPENSEVKWEDVTSVGWPAGLGKFDRAFTVDKQVLTATPAQNVFSTQTIELFWQATILVLQLTLIFVFVALSVMLLIRSVALIIIFVLAPLGFLAAVLPATRGYANQWWHKLFQWSFFFPASAFMIYLSIAYGAQMSQIVKNGSQVVNTGMLFNYFVTVALLIGSLIVAKQMGIVGAAAAIGIGAGLAKRARGYAGRTSMAGVYAARRATAPVVGKAAEKLAGFGVAGRIIAKPFSKYAVAGEKDRAAREKQYKEIAGMSKSAIKAAHAGTVNPAEQRRIRQAAIEADKGDVFDREDLKKDFAVFEQQGNKKAMRNIAGVDPGLVAIKTGESVADAMRRLNIKLTAKDVENFDDPVANDKEVARVVAEIGTPKVLQAVADRGGDLFNNVRDSYAAISKKGVDDALTAGRAISALDGLNEALGTTYKNAAAARYVLSSPAGAMFKP